MTVSEASMVHRLDIVSEVCPMTFVRVKLLLETLEVGDLLEVRLKGAEPLRNVPKSVVEEGHELVQLHAEADGTSTLLIRVAR
jgi:tRNA 2-thiouridine synthesizing protein A